MVLTDEEKEKRRRERLEKTEQRLAERGRLQQAGLSEKGARREQTRQLNVALEQALTPIEQAALGEEKFAERTRGLAEGEGIEEVKEELLAQTLPAGQPSIVPPEELQVAGRGISGRVDTGREAIENLRVENKRRRDEALKLLKQVSDKSLKSNSPIQVEDLPLNDLYYLAGKEMTNSLSLFAAKTIDNFARSIPLGLGEPIVVITSWEDEKIQNARDVIRASGETSSTILSQLSNGATPDATFIKLKGLADDINKYEAAIQLLAINSPKLKFDKEYIVVEGEILKARNEVLERLEGVSTFAATGSTTKSPEVVLYEAGLFSIANLKTSI